MQKKWAEIHLIEGFSYEKANDAPIFRMDDFRFLTNPVAGVKARAGAREVVF